MIELGRIFNVCGEGLNVAVLPVALVMKEIKCYLLQSGKSVEHGNISQLCSVSSDIVRLISDYSQVSWFSPTHSLPPTFFFPFYK